MKKLTSLEDTATITITGREAVMLRTLMGRTHHKEMGIYSLFDKVEVLLDKTDYLTDHNLVEIFYSGVQEKQEAITFPESKKDLMLKELQSKMDDLQCEIDKIKGGSF